MLGGIRCLVEIQSDAIRLKCVSITPLEIPVVPLENGIDTTSSFGLIFTVFGNAAPSSDRRAEIDSQPWASPMTITERIPFKVPELKACIAREGMVTRYFAREVFSWWARSRSVYCGFTVVMTPPRHATPWKMIGYSKTFGREIARTSPFLNPLLTKAEPNRRVWSFIWL